MRKEQLANLKIGDKVKGYGSEDIFTVTRVPEGEGRYILEGTITTLDSSTGLRKGREVVKGVSESSILKNYKLVEEEPQPEAEEVAVTVETEEINLTLKEKEFLYHMTNNCFSNILESGFEFTFAVVDELSYSEQQAKGVISSLTKKGLIDITQEKGEHSLVSFTDEGKEYTEQNLEMLKAAKGSKVPPTIKEEKEVEEITASELAQQLGLTPQDLRRQLRKGGYVKPEGGWKWNINSEEYRSVVNTLTTVQEKRRDTQEKRRSRA